MRCSLFYRVTEKNAELIRLATVSEIGRVSFMALIHNLKNGALETIRVLTFYLYNRKRLTNHVLAYPKWT